MIGDCDLVNSCKFALGVLVKRFGNVREFLKKLHFLELFFKDRSESSYFQLSEFFACGIFPKPCSGEVPWKLLQTSGAQLAAWSEKTASECAPFQKRLGSKSGKLLC